MTALQPNIVAVLARVYVDDLDAAIPLYRQLADGEQPRPFQYHGVRLATIGPFLLIEGADQEIRARAATITVRDVSLVARSVIDAGGRLLEGPAEGPNGRRLIACHPDGNTIEYAQVR